MVGDKPLSILQICSASEAIYGAALSLLTLARAQRAAGHRVEFVTFAGKRFTEQVRDEGFGAHEVRVRAKIDPPAILKMRRIAMDGKFDVIHTHLSTSSVNGGLAGRMAKVPAVATVHGLSHKLSFSTANHLIAVSEQVRLHLVGQGVQADKVTVVYNGMPVQESRLGKSEARALVGLPDGTIVVGTVSRVTPLKGIEDALRAVGLLVKEFPDMRYLLVGDGDGMQACRDLSKGLGIAESVMFLGYRSNVNPFLDAMDIFLFPSHKEALGMSLVEALAAGLPVVATDIGGIPEVVTPDCGRLVPVHRPDALAQAAHGLIENYHLRNSMGAAGRRRVEAIFTDTAMQAATEAVYRRLISRSLAKRS